MPEGYSEATAQALSATEQDVIDYELVETTLEVQKTAPLFGQCFRFFLCQ